MLPRLIITDSPETRDRLIRGGVPADKVITVAPGVDLDTIAAAPPSAGYDLLFAGRLIAHKGVAMALEAVQLLQQRGILMHLRDCRRGPRSRPAKATV